MCVCVCVLALRIVSMDKILRFTNTLRIINYYYYIHIDRHIIYCHRNGLGSRFVKRACQSKEDSLELGFQPTERGDILKTGRQLIPDRWSDETE